ncbi:hypothetical protein ISX56_35350, partial [Serratia ureilytica]|nr:hypothetical protein [Serratia ureilytica]
MNTPAAKVMAREQLEKSGKPTNDAAVMKQAYDNAMRQYGTGSDLQKAALAGLGAFRYRLRDPARRARWHAFI